MDSIIWSQTAFSCFICISLEKQANIGYWYQAKIIHILHPFIDSKMTQSSSDYLHLKIWNHVDIKLKQLLDYQNSLATNFID